VTSTAISLLTAWRLAARARDKGFTLAARRSFESFGPGSSLRLPIRIDGEETISIGRDVFVGPGSRLSTVDGGVIRIGDSCAFADSVVIIAARSIVIEPRAVFGRNVQIYDHSHGLDPDLPIGFGYQELTGIEPVVVGEGSWIGANVVILPGVAIGRRAVVGANSVVREDVRDRVVVVGAPAREVRELDRS
jgi:acetyltransferase-like isoleucine patch superfamily enzyme